MKADLLFCPIRKQWVAALPEEQVRQRLLHHLIHDLGFPAGGVAVEMPLMHIPHLQTKNVVIPDRRADIICFSKENETLRPLLMVECKAIPLTQKVIQQVAGYNHYVQATYIAIANKDELRMGWYDPEKTSYQFIPYIPTYASLNART